MAIKNNQYNIQIFKQESWIIFKLYGKKELFYFQLFYLIKSQQLTMNSKRTISKRNKNNDQNLQSLLKINKQYQQLLQKLSQNNYVQSQQSPQAYLFNTLQSIKQLNSCMKQQLKQYDRFSSPLLQNFINQNQLINSSNMISKYESLLDQIQTYRQAIQTSKNNHSQEHQYQILLQEQKKLQEEMRKLTNRRIELRNKNQMIAYQVQCGETDLNEMKVKVFEQELKLRQIQNINKNPKKK